MFKVIENYLRNWAEFSEAKNTTDSCFKGIVRKHGVDWTKPQWEKLLLSMPLIK